MPKQQAVASVFTQFLVVKVTRDVEATGSGFTRAVQEVASDHGGFRDNEDEDAAAASPKGKNTNIVTLGDGHPCMPFDHAPATPPYSVKFVGCDTNDNPSTSSSTDDRTEMDNDFANVNTEGSPKIVLVTARVDISPGAHNSKDICSWMMGFQEHHRVVQQHHTFSTAEAPFKGTVVVKNEDCRGPFSSL